MCRLNCAREKAYNVEKLEDRRDASLFTEKESAGKDRKLSATEDMTEVQETNKSIDSCLLWTQSHSWASHNKLLLYSRL